MKNYKFMGSSNTGTFSWLMQRISGIILILVIFAHFFGKVYDAGFAAEGFILYPVAAFGLFHTFNGFKMVTDDYVASAGWRAVIFGAYWMLGVTLFVLAIKAI